MSDRDTATMPAGPASQSHLANLRPPQQKMSFTDWARTRPSQPIPGDRLDQELAEQRVVIAALVDFVRPLVDANGGLKLGLVGRGNLDDQLAAEVKALASAGTAENWAYTSQAWAEYLEGNASIPPHLLSVMGITGEHWSSRYWAKVSADNANSYNDILAEMDALWDQFSDLYLGAKSAPPATDNDGDPLIAGAMYFDLTTDGMFVWNGTNWTPIAGTGGGGGEGGAVSSVNGQTGIVVLGAADVGALALAGGTLTGDLNLREASPALILNKLASGQNALIRSQMDGLNRWAFDFGNNTAESGDNAGSDFVLNAYSDTGTWIGPAFTVTRATRRMTMGGELVLAGAPTTNNMAATKLYVDQKAAAYLPLAGGALTGTLEIDVAAGANADLYLDKGGSGQMARVISQNNDVIRWIMSLGDSGSEAGSNAGSDFRLARYSDAGAWISDALHISRAGGAATFNGDVNIAPSGAAGNAFLALNAKGAVDNPILAGKKDGVSRWFLVPGYEAGGDFSLLSFDDAGAYRDTPFTISRANGKADFKSIRPTVASGVYAVHTGWRESFVASSGLNIVLNGRYGSHYVDGANTSGSLLMHMPNDMLAGDTGIIYIQQGTAGGLAVVWNGVWVFPDGTPSLNTAGGNLSIIAYDVMWVGANASNSGYIVCKVVKS